VDSLLLLSGRRCNGEGAGSRLRAGTRRVRHRCRGFDLTALAKEILGGDGTFAGLAFASFTLGRFAAVASGWGPGW
jgi:hypothetical protein